MNSAKCLIILETKGTPRLGQVPIKKISTGELLCKYNSSLKLLFSHLPFLCFHLKLIMMLSPFDFLLILGITSRRGGHRFQLEAN